MIVGDSISDPLRYSQTATATTPKAWWAYLVDAYDTPAPILSADSGSGMLRIGNASDTGKVCLGTTFGNRLSAVSTSDWKLLIIEGGRNDFRKCVNGKPVRASKTVTASAIKVYMRRLRAIVDAKHRSPHDVYVFTPWGTAFAKDRKTIWPLVGKYAKQSGFQWVAVPQLQHANAAGQVYSNDNTHPTTLGSRRLYLDLISPKRSNLAKRLEALSP
jgi:hypothetical protein